MRPPYTILGDIPGLEVDAAIVVRGAYHPQAWVVSRLLMDDAPDLFSQATRLPPGCRAVELPVLLDPGEGPVLNPLDPEYGPPAPHFSTRRLELQTMVVNKQWRVRCAYDGPTDSWFVAGEPTEVPGVDPGIRWATRKDGGAVDPDLFHAAHSDGKHLEGER